MKGPKRTFNWITLGNENPEPAEIHYNSDDKPDQIWLIGNERPFYPDEVVIGEEIKRRAECQ